MGETETKTNRAPDAAAIAAERTGIQRHIAQVAAILQQAAGELIKRGEVHDASKLEEPELPVFAAAPRHGKEIAYASAEYEERLRDLEPALEHHYAKNSHHPQHYANGVAGMNLFDLIEMAVDWAVTANDYGSGDIKASINANQARFEMSDQLTSILLNTVAFFETHLEAIAAPMTVGGGREER